MPGKSRIALTMASAMSGVNVSFSPNFSWKAFLLALRHCTRLVTSASTNEVTWGLVWTLRTMWSAIILRIRSISTMSWAPSTLVAAGAALATGARAGTGAGLAAGAA